MGLLRRAPENPIRGPWAIDEFMVTGPAVQQVGSGTIVLATLDVSPDPEQENADGAIIITGSVDFELDASDDVAVTCGFLPEGLTRVITASWLVAAGPPVHTGIGNIPVQLEIGLFQLVAAPPWTITLQANVIGAANATYEANTCMLRVGLVERPSPRLITVVP